MSFPLTNGQRAALDAVRCGRNVFISGPGGVGKSYIVNHIIHELEDIGKDVLVTASTGKAATLIGGTTCHRALQIPLKMTWAAEPEVTTDSPVYYADVMLIDEVSMLRIDAFEYVAKTIDAVNTLRKSPDYLSNPENTHRDPVQLIVIGDFLQLSPVVKHHTNKAYDEGIIMSDYYGYDVSSGYAFLAPGWTRCNFLVCELTEVVRQSDKELINAENALRIGDRSALPYFTTHARKRAFSKKDDSVVYLCGTNKTAEHLNNTELAKLTGKEQIYYATVIGDVDDQDKQAPDRIKLKVGAHVMMLQNTESYKNGSSGIVVALYNELVSVRIVETGQIIEVPYTTWNIDRYAIKTDGKKKKLVKEQVGSFSQLPLRLSYALTIHKSQGQTFDKVVLIPEIFAYGQLYVALSRITSVRGLYIKGDLWSVKKLASPEVIKFYTDATTNPPTKHPEVSYSKTRQNTENNLSKGSTSMEKIDIPNSLHAVIQVFAKTLDPTSYTTNESSIYVAPQYAEAVKSFIEKVNVTK